MFCSPYKQIQTPSEDTSYSLQRFNAAGDGSVASTADADGSSCAHSVTPPLLASQTDTIPSTLSPPSDCPENKMKALYSYGLHSVPAGSNIDPLEVYTPLMYGSIYKHGEDIVGQYLEQRAAMQYSYMLDSLQAPYLNDNDHYPEDRSRFDKVMGGEESTNYTLMKVPLVPRPFRISFRLPQHQVACNFIPIRRAFATSTLYMAYYLRSSQNESLML
jgi:hypothetical protein